MTVIICVSVLLINDGITVRTETVRTVIANMSIVKVIIEIMIRVLKNINENIGMDLRLSRTTKPVIIVLSQMQSSLS